MEDLFIDIYQGRQIASAKADAGRAIDSLGNLKDEIAFLNKKICKLALINAALWELLREKVSLTDDDLKNRIHEIDARDGNVDGKIGSQKRLCVKCQKVLHVKHDKCLYCGHDNKSGDIFHV
jgi:hypothetical protein